MTKYFTLALNAINNPKPAQAGTRPTRLPRLRLKNPGIWIISLLFISGVFYILQVSSNSTKGYEIKTLEERLIELQEQNERLEIEATSLKTIENIEAETRAMNLVPVGQASHVSGDGSFSYKR